MEAAGIDVTPNQWKSDTGDFSTNKTDNEEGFGIDTGQYNGGQDWVEPWEVYRKGWRNVFLEDDVIVVHKERI